jgi:hypothetical protein
VYHDISDLAWPLQALRHFYVLAANPRIMRAIDVHVRQPVYVPVSLTVAPDGSSSAPVATGGPDAAAAAENVPANAQHQHQAADVRVPAGTQAGGGAAGRKGGASGTHRQVSAAMEGLSSGGRSPLLAAPAAAAGGAVTKRLCPCIMPEPHALRGVEVDGIRYWAQRIDSRRHGPVLEVRSSPQMYTISPFVRTTRSCVRVVHCQGIVLTENFCR